MDIIGVIGSSRNGNSKILVEKVLFELQTIDNGIQFEIINLGEKILQYCDGCLYCDEHGLCHIDDGMNEINNKLSNSSVLLICTPTRWSSMSGELKVFLDRTNPLAVPEKLAGKSSLIIALGQSDQTEEEKSILKAAKSVENYCTNAGINVIGMEIFYNCLEKKDILKQTDLDKRCKTIAEKLYSHLRD